MTPQQPPRTDKSQVGVRELRDHLNSYVEDAGNGHSTVVTVRGKPVARLVPIDAAPDPYEELRRRGAITEPTRPKSRQIGRKRIKVKGSVSDLVKEQRR